MMSLNGKTVLCVIPARGGSKRILRKSMRTFAGNPLIYYTFVVAKQSAYLDCVVLSSDDQKVIEYAHTQDIDVPFRRPKELASDLASSSDVACHALSFLEKKNKFEYDYVCLLEPTAPLRTADDLDASLEKLILSEADSLMSLIPALCVSPYRLRYVVDNVVTFFDKDKFMNRQQNPSKYKQTYLPGGGIFCVKSELLKKEKSLIAGNQTSFLMKLYHGIDIDTIDDFIMAECFFKNRDQMRKAEQKFMREDKQEKEI